MHIGAGVLGCTGARVAGPGMGILLFEVCIGIAIGKNRLSWATRLFGGGISCTWA